MPERTTVANESRVRAAAGAGFCLLVIEAGRLRSYRIELGRPVLIGRSAQADVRLEDARVSREHARLHVGESIEIEDLGSANGTWLRGVSISPSARTHVSPGDGISIGNALVLLKPAGDELNGALGLSTPPGTPAPSHAPDIIIDDPQMRHLHELAARVAASRINVLVLGETGTGKELLAETIHRCSGRARETFLCLNCAAITESLLEGELFGHERGAFTGAHQAKAGLLESASGGTLFLDEVGEMSAATQAKLLRVLETRQVIRVGSNKARPIDVRLVSATNRELAAEVDLGRFRRDLYFRLNTLTLRIPPLRERKSEIAPLARRFITLLSQAGSLPEPLITAAAIEQLERYSWPGNVRELRNVIERALVFSGSQLDVEHLTFEVAQPASPCQPASAAPPLQAPSGTPIQRELAELERSRILEALERLGGNQTRAAAELGISRRTLLKRLDRYGAARPRKLRHPGARQP